ncbi:MAG: PQQ-dependent sugar dehydrogenase [Acidimicrobiales bacterium]
MPAPRARFAAALTAAAALVGVVGCGTDTGPQLERGAEDPAPAIDDNAPVARDGSLDEVAVKLVPIATLPYPVAMATRPGSDDLWVAQQAGAVRQLVTQDDGTYQVPDGFVLDARADVDAGGERGLLGLAFSADGEELYVYYTAKGTGTLTVAEYAMDGDVADPGSKRIVIEIAHPRPNHNGGQLQLGPDGMLYLGPGDGGGAGDPDRNGQNTDTLLGKLLRIDPTAPADGKAYGIPAGNPFADGGGAPEVWSYGLRNPWRFSFDADTGDLWIGDVGQNLIEEIDFAPATPEGAGRGLNFGWSLMEGTSPFEDGSAPDDHTPPIFDYGRDGGRCTVVGGYVYRGSAIDGLQGAYVWGDFCTSDVRVLLQEDGRVVDERSLGVSVTANTLASFGQGPDGELYVLSLDDTIYALVPA